MLKQNIHRPDKDHCSFAAEGIQLIEFKDPETEVLDLIVEFMNSNNLAVDLKTKQTNSFKTAGESSEKHKLSKVSKYF